MAITDFNNRDPNDPNGIYSLDTTSSSDAWITPDWTTIVYSQSDATKAGATQKVRVATAVTNDGHKYNVILGENNQPLSPIGDSIGTDDARARAFADQKARAASQAGDTSVPGMRSYPGVDPQTGQPAMVTEYPNNPNKTYRPLKPEEIKALQDQKESEANAALPKDQDPQYETNAQRAARAERTIAAQNAQAAQTRADASQARQERRLDDQEARAAAAGSRIVVNNQLYEKGTDGTWSPVTPRPAEIIKGGGKNGEDVQATFDPASGTWKYVPIAGANVPAANQTIPAGAPKFVPDYTKDDLGLTDYNEQLLQANQAGIISRQQGQQLLEQAGALASTTASHGATLRNEASATRAQDITQRQQDLGEVQNRRANTGNGFDTLFQDINSNAAHLGRDNGGLAADAFIAAMNMRNNAIQNTGGYATVPQVPSPAIQAARTTTVHPDGTVQVSHPVDSNPAVGPVAAGVTATNAAAVNPTGANVQAANDATMAGSNAAFGNLGVGPGATTPATPAFTPPPPVDAAPVSQTPAYLNSVRNAPLWSPDPVIQDLKRRGFSDSVIAQALQEHTDEFGSAA